MHETCKQKSVSYREQRAEGVEGRWTDLSLCTENCTKVLRHQIMRNNYSVSDPHLAIKGVTCLTKLFCFYLVALLTRLL